MTVQSRRNGLTLVELLVVVGILALLFALLLPAVQSAREAARNAQCKNNFKNVLLATLNFQSSRGEFPVGVQRLQHGEHLHVKTWAALIAPFLEQSGVQIEYDDELCICSPRNQNALLNPGAIFICPSMPQRGLLVEFEAGNVHEADRITATPTHIHPPGDIGAELRALVRTGSGRTLIRDDHKNRGEKLVPDGFSNTIMFVETTAPERYENGREVSGVVPGGSCFLPGTSFVEERCDFASNRSIRGEHKSSFTFHPGGLPVGFADGHVESLSPSIEPKVYAALLSKDDGGVAQAR